MTAWLLTPRLLTHWLLHSRLIPLDVPIDIGREEARRRALEELQKAKYGGTPPWLERFLDRIFDWLAQLLEFLIRLQAGRMQSGGGINWGFLAVVLILLAVIALIIWRIGIPRWRARRTDAELELDPTLEALDYRRSAEAAAAAGDWRGAVRDRYRAIIRELEVRTILQPRPSRTAWEAAGLASRLLPQVSDALFSGADIFNQVMYGDKVSAPDRYQQMVQIDEVVVQAADDADIAAEEDKEVPVP